MENYGLKKGVKVACFMVFYVVVFGAIVLNLWNWLMPTLFNLPLISFPQALGLFLLSRILTGGFHMMKFGGVGSSEDCPMQNKMFENWKNMSAEERERAKETWKNDWRTRCNDRRPIGFHKPEPTETETKIETEYDKSKMI